MDLTRVDESKRSLGENHLGKDHQLSIRSTSSSSNSKSTSETSSRSNSVDELKITDNEFINSSNQNNSLNSNFGSLANCSPYISNTNSTTSSTISANATYNVNQDFLLRMAMQNNTSVNNPITNNNMFHLYQSALNTTTSSSSIANSTITAAHHLAALNPHNSAFQNLQQQNINTHQQLTSQPNTNSQTNGHSSSLHNSTNLNSVNQNSSPASVLPNADHLLSTMTNGTNQSLLAVANNLIGTNGTNGSVTNTNGLASNSLSSSLSTNGSTNSSSSNGSIANNSQMIINEHFLNGTNSLINQNQILASQSPFLPSALIDSSTNNIFSSIKKRKRSPQPIPQDLKDDAYWDRRRRNNESAKRSREVRRHKEQHTALRLMYLEKRNLQLQTELEMMKEEAKKMHDIIYCQRYGQQDQQDKHL